LKTSRAKKAMINTVLELLLEAVTVICSFILPRLILVHFGSTYNGITSSITQFIGYVALMKAGIGGVTRAALYKPLAENDSTRLSSIVNATSRFMRKIAMIFSISIVVFAIVYPFMVENDFEWFFSASLVLILSISTFAQYFFGLTYQMVLQADQKTYIISFISIITTVLNTLISSALILLGFGIHIVKLASAIVFVIPPIIYNSWVKKEYNINTRVEPDYTTISQRWDAFGHQIAGFINSNFPIILTTIFLGVKEVSVYTIYNMVCSAIKKLIHAFSSGTTAAFGNLLANREDKLLKKRFEQFECLIFFLTTIVVALTVILILPFVRIYTSGITDVNYMRPTLAALISISIYSYCIKLPYEQIVYAAGEFKNTRNSAFIEAGLNIVVSVILVNFIGLNGIVLGTIVAALYRVIRYHIYVCDRIIPRRKTKILMHFVYTIVCIVTSYTLYNLISFDNPNGYFEWIIQAVIAGVVVVAVSTIYAIFVYRGNLFSIFKLMLRSIEKRR